LTYIPLARDAGDDESEEFLRIAMRRERSEP
jgi:hypothetical protein